MKPHVRVKVTGDLATVTLGNRSTDLYDRPWALPARIHETVVAMVAGELGIPEAEVTVAHYDLSINHHTTAGHNTAS